MSLASFVPVAGDMGEASEILKARTMRFALNVCALIRLLPREEPGPTVRRQLAKSATGVAFNYRASCRSRSHDEFTARISVVAEESDESQGWLDFIEAAKLISNGDVRPLLIEATELTAIFSAASGTARATQRSRRK